MLQGEQVECPVFHKFYPGYYIRTMLIPKGTVIIGMTHKVESANVVLDGHIRIMIDGEPREFKTGDRFLSYAGSKKIGNALEETLFANIFETTETDLEKLESECVYTDSEERKLLMGVTCLGQQ